MLELLIGILISTVTQISKNRGISAKWIVLWLSILVWAFYYFSNKLFADEVQIVWKTVLEIYWVSQIIYNYAIKRFEEKPKNE